MNYAKQKDFQDAKDEAKWYRDGYHWLSTAIVDLVEKKMGVKSPDALCMSADEAIKWLQER